MDGRYLIKCKRETLDQWREAAESDGVTLAAWIRGTLTAHASLAGVVDMRKCTLCGCVAPMVGGELGVHLNLVGEVCDA